VVEPPPPLPLPPPIGPGLAALFVEDLPLPPLLAT